MHDALGSIAGRVGGTSRTTVRFDAWGAFRSGAEPGMGDPSRAYAGQHWDADLGLSYAQQRWYDARSGRFLSEDPVFGDLRSPIALHRFAYAYANPLRFIDPLGLAPPGAPTIGPTPPVTLRSIGAKTRTSLTCHFAGLFKVNDRECADYWHFVGELPLVGPMIRGTIQAPIGLATGDDPWTKFMLDCRGEGNDCTSHPQVRWSNGSPHWIPMSRLDPTRQFYADAVMVQSLMTLAGAAPGLPVRGAPVGPAQLEFAFMQTLPRQSAPAAAGRAAAADVAAADALGAPTQLELAVLKTRTPDVAGLLPKRIPPRGFASEAQFSDAVTELKAIAERFGDPQARVRVRGSSTTGLSQNPNKPGKWFGSSSDIDVALESEVLSEALRAAGQQPSRNVPGLFLPEKIKTVLPELYGELMRWNKKWAEIVGHDMAPAVNDPRLVRPAATDVVR